MLYKSLYFKLVLMLVLFIICIISIIAAVMLRGVFDFYTTNFIDMMKQTLNEDTLKTLSRMMNTDGGNENFYEAQKNALQSEYGNLGINNYRNLYILNINGNYLTGTDDELGRSLIKTPNMLAAMNKQTGDKQSFGADYMDYAVYLSGDMYGSGNPAAFGSVKECIIYIKDTQEEMKNFSWKIFEIIVQVLLIGLAVAVLLSFLLAKAITSPIQSITGGALKLADGDFKRKIEVASNDEIGTLALTFNDMAEKLKATIDEVSSEREKLQIIFLYLNDGVLVFSNEGKLILINPQGTEILRDNFGYDNDFNDFLNLLNLNTEDENDETGDKSAGRIFKDISYGENIFDISIGKFKYTQDEDKPSKSSDGVIVVIHDVTQSYALEKSRREFIANVSHELRTPLTSIKGAAETIQESRIAEETKTKFLNIILGESDRMTRIVKDLLVISRIDNKKMMWQFTAVNAVLLAKNVYETMRSEAEKNGQNLTLRTSKNIPVIYADKERIEQVLVNIISNAIKYTPKGGKIEFSLDGYIMKNGGAEFAGVKFVIKDNGIGIPKEDLPRIFERFYRVEKARSSEAGGTGLGLAIAKEIVLSHKGQITVDSTPGDGTVVTVILPQYADKPET